MAQRRESLKATLKRKLKKLEQQYERAHENATIKRSKLMNAYEKTEKQLKDIERG